MMQLLRDLPGPERLPSRGLVDIVSGSFGAGHDAAAAAIAGQLQDRGLRTRTWDVVDLMPGPLGRVVRTGYLKQVQALPTTWRWLLHEIEHRNRVAGYVTRALETCSGPLLDIAADRPELIISTHPFASQALGQLRAEGRLDVPVVTYLTDMSVHRLWVHPAVDTHLAIHDLPAREARAHGAGATSTIVPAVSGSFTRVAHGSVARSGARAGLGLPASTPLAVVTGGSCGIGRLEQSAQDIAATGLITPVVLCGTNKRLLARLRRNPAVIALGWVADMPRLLTAVDVVVQNAGGITSLETMAAGVPMITYRCIAGHGETNAAALDAAGLATWVRAPSGLAAALLAALYAAPFRTARRDGAQSVADSLFGVPALTA